MRIIPTTQIKFTLPNCKKVVNQIGEKTVHQIKPDRVNKNILWTLVGGILYPVLCDDDADNNGYGDPDWLKEQRQREEDRRHNDYMGYDTPGLGSGYRETTWDN